MAVRQSLRLHGLGPELQTYRDHCFICLLDLDVGSILRCQPMPCCGKLLHKRCFRKATANSFQCGHCRRIIPEDSNDSTDTLQTNETMEDNSHLEDDYPIWQPPEEIQGPTLIERARTAIADLRAWGKNLSQHLATGWPNAPKNVAICCVGMLRSFGRGFRNHLAATSN